MSPWRLPLLLALSILPLSCSSAPKPDDPAVLEAQAAVKIQSIPAANPDKYRGMIEMKNWRNPYLIVRRDGVGLLDVANNEQRLLKPQELLQALAQLPDSAWPYGRVVAVSENGVRADGDDVLIRKNRALVAGTLKGVHVLINWVPSA